MYSQLRFITVKGRVPGSARGKDSLASLSKFSFPEVKMRAAHKVLPPPAVKSRNIFPVFLLREAG